MLLYACEIWGPDLLSYKTHFDKSTIELVHIKFCKQTLEDEKHFLMYCQGFTTIRHELCSNISKIDVSYIHLSENERTKYLLRADNKNTSKIVGKFIHLMFKKGKSFLIYKHNENYIHIFFLLNELYKNLILLFLNCIS